MSPCPSFSRRSRGATPALSATARSVALLLLIGSLVSRPARADSSDALDLMRQALTEAKAGQTAAALTDMQTAVAMRPDHPAYLYNLACIQCLAGETGPALQTLGTIAGYGMYVPAATDPDFAALRAMPRFRQICQTLDHNRAPQGAANLAFTLPGQNGLIEGITFRSATDDTFFGDLHRRCVWRRDREGHLSRFTPPDPVLPGIGGLAVDEHHGLLWAACSAQPVMQGWTEIDDDRDGLAAFDLQTGALKHYYTLPSDDRDHATVDLTVGADGTVYLSDSKAPVIWRLRPGAAQLEPWIDDPRIHSLQGLTLSADDRQLFAADYARGLWRIDTNTGDITLLPPPVGTTLVGIDGLARHGHQLIAIQNGVHPGRVLAIDLDSSLSPVTVRVLAAALPEMADPTLGCISKGAYLFIGQAGWDLFSAKREIAFPHRDVPVLSIPLRTRSAP